MTSPDKRVDHSIIHTEIHSFVSYSQHGWRLLRENGVCVCVCTCVWPLCEKIRWGAAVLALKSVKPWDGTSWKSCWSFAANKKMLTSCFFACCMLHNMLYVRFDMFFISCEPMCLNAVWVAFWPWVKGIQSLTNACRLCPCNIVQYAVFALTFGHSAHLRALFGLHWDVVKGHLNILQFKHCMWLFISSCEVSIRSHSWLFSLKTLLTSLNNQE